MALHKKNYLICQRVLSVFITLMIIPSLLIPTPVHAFTVGEERELGEKLLYQVRSAFPVLGDPDLYQYLNDIGKEVLDVAGIQFFDYRFYVVESNQFNAFAAPSGLIFFYTELIEAMQSEDELVSVIAHEIAHVVKRHLASRMKKGTIVGVAALGAALAAIALGGGGAATQALLTGSLAAGQSAQLYFSREDEKEADLLAYQWIKDLGRDPEGQKKMLQTMRRIVRYRMGQVPQYLLTHPDPEARLDYVDSLLSADNDLHVHTNEEKDFAFLRFKYRIMSIVKNSASKRAYFASRLADQHATPFAKVMATYGLSQMDLSENNYDLALQRIDEVIKMLPDKQILLVDKAIILAGKGGFQQARDLLEEALLNNPGDPYTTYHLARTLESLGELERAEQLYRTVANKLPEYPKPYFDLGRILSTRGEVIESRFVLGKYYLYEGNLKLAESCFKEVAGRGNESLKEQSTEYLELIERLRKS